MSFAMIFAGKIKGNSIISPFIYSLNKSTFPGERCFDKLKTVRLQLSQHSKEITQDKNRLMQNSVPRQRAGNWLQLN